MFKRAWIICSKYDNHSITLTFVISPSFNVSPLLYPKTLGDGWSHFQFQSGKLLTMNECEQRYVGSGVLDAIWYKNWWGKGGEGGVKKWREIKGGAQRWSSYTWWEQGESNINKLWRGWEGRGGWKWERVNYLYKRISHPSNIKTWLSIDLLLIHLK